MLHRQRAGASTLNTVTGYWLDRRESYRVILISRPLYGTSLSWISYHGRKFCMHPGRDALGDWVELIYRVVMACGFQVLRLFQPRQVWVGLFLNGWLLHLCIVAHATNIQVISTGNVSSVSWCLVIRCAQLPQCHCLLLIHSKKDNSMKQ